MHIALPINGCESHKCTNNCTARRLVAFEEVTDICGKQTIKFQVSRVVEVYMDYLKILDFLSPMFLQLRLVYIITV